MAAIVLVHGIAQEQLSADVLEANWLPALAGGLRVAGYAQLADQVWKTSRPDASMARMAFYGDRFLNPGAQGSSGSIEISEMQWETAEEIALSWVENATQSSRPSDAGNARIELASARPTGTAQGVRSGLRRVISGLDNIPWFTQGGLAAGGIMNKALLQVTRYLTEPNVRDYAMTSVRNLIDSNTRVIIGHSLGSVVAYEVARELEKSVPLFVTLGSPLGLSPIRGRLKQEPAYPSAITRWVNLADRNDCVASGASLSAFYERNKPDGCILESHLTVDNGSKPHEATFYLSKEQLGSPVGEILSNQADSFSG